VLCSDAFSTTVCASYIFKVPVENNVNFVALAEMRMVRWMCNVMVKDRVSSKELRERLGIDDIILLTSHNRAIVTCMGHHSNTVHDGGQQQYDIGGAQAPACWHGWAGLLPPGRTGPGGVGRAAETVAQTDASNY